MNRNRTLTALVLSCTIAASPTSAVQDRASDQDRGRFDENLPVASLQRVRNQAEIAQQRLRWAVEANQEVPGSVGEDDLRAYRLKAEMAQLALRRAEQPGYFDDPMTHLQWQLNRLRAEVLELLVRMEQTESGS